MIALACVRNNPVLKPGGGICQFNIIMRPVWYSSITRVRPSLNILLQGYYDSCDAGVMDENGYITIHGRVDDVIQVAGHRLSTKQMEQVYLTF